MFSERCYRTVKASTNCAVTQMAEAMHYKPAGSFPMVSLEFFTDLLPAALWHWGRLNL